MLIEVPSTVADAMTSDVAGVDENGSLENLLESMRALRVRHLPVTDDNHLIGLVTERYLLRTADSDIMPLGAERNRLAGDQGRFTGGPQHIDHVDWDIDLRERAKYALAEELATARIHGHNPLALRL